MTTRNVRVSNPAPSWQRNDRVGGSRRPKKKTGAASEHSRPNTSVRGKTMAKKSKRATKSGSRKPRRKARTAAQKAATKRMIAANRKKARGASKPRKARKTSARKSARKGKKNTMATKKRGGKKRRSSKRRSHKRHTAHRRHSRGLFVIQGRKLNPFGLEGTSSVKAALKATAIGLVAGAAIFGTMKLLQKFPGKTKTTATLITAGAGVVGGVVAAMVAGPVAGALVATSFASIAVGTYFETPSQQVNGLRPLKPAILPQIGGVLAPNMRGMRPIGAVLAPDLRGLTAALTRRQADSVADHEIEKVISTLNPKLSAGYR